jgi:hypothetical protein
MQTTTRIQRQPVLLTVQTLLGLEQEQQDVTDRCYSSVYVSHWASEL